MSEDLTSQAPEGFLSVPNTADAVEPELVPAGDYTLRLTRVDNTNSKKGDPMLHLIFAVEDSGMVNPAPVHSYLMHPLPSDDEGQTNNKRLGFKRFFECFNVPVDENGGVELAMLEGLTGSVSLSIRPGKGEYGPSNNISKWHKAH